MLKSLDKVKKMPLIAILRGITPDEAEAVSTALVQSGFIFMEVTLNSPNWQESLQKMKDLHGDNILLGAGTVLTVDQVEILADMGVEAVISPNMDIDVIKATKKHNMISIPGCYTPTECFNALKAGADVIKIFPADNLGVKHIKALSAVLPSDTKICPTGGVTVGNMAEFKSAGVYTMGMGSFLYKPGATIADITKNAKALVAAFNQ